MHIKYFVLIVDSERTLLEVLFQVVVDFLESSPRYRIPSCTCICRATPQILLRSLFSRPSKPAVKTPAKRTFSSNNKRDVHPNLETEVCVVFGAEGFPRPSRTTLPSDRQTHRGRETNFRAIVQASAGLLSDYQILLGCMGNSHITPFFCFTFFVFFNLEAELVWGAVWPSTPGVPQRGSPQSSLSLTNAFSSCASAFYLIS